MGRAGDLSDGTAGRDSGVVKIGDSDYVGGDYTGWKQYRGSEPVPMLQAAIGRFPYAVALRQQLALSLMGSTEFSDHEAARVEIEELFNLACVFRDHEFLSRFGRIYKDKGDQLLGESMSHQELLHHKPLAYRHYLAAFQYYETAFQITGGRARALRCVRGMNSPDGSRRSAFKECFTALIDLP